MNRLLLVLDLDETLMLVCPGPAPEFFDFVLAKDHYGIRRPHLDRFLDFVFARFEIAVWSSAAPDYVDEAVRLLFPSPHRLKFVWSRPRCTLRRDPEADETYWLKDLKKVRRRGWRLERVVALDDKPASYRRHRGNFVHVAPFKGDREDSELLRLMPVLEGMAALPNVRMAPRRDLSRLDSVD